jgi:hypothetical protein
MPASAHPGADENVVGDQAPRAAVIDLSSRRRLAAAGSAAAPESESEPAVLEDARLVAMFEEQGGGDAAQQTSVITAMVERAVADRGAHLPGGVSLADPAVAAAVRAVADLMERVMYGGMTTRYGDPARGIEANPEDGIDHVGAQMVMDLLAGLRDAADAFSPQQRKRM